MHLHYVMLVWEMANRNFKRNDELITPHWSGRAMAQADSHRPLTGEDRV